jgi:hypothetical protein
MSKLHLQLVSLTLLLCLSSFCATKGASHQGQVGSPQPATLLANGQLNSSAVFADGGDPAPPPIPLPGAPKPPTKPPSVSRDANRVLVADGGDPVPEPIPLPHPKFANQATGNLLADGGDPVPPPIPLPGAPKPPTKPPSLSNHSVGVLLADGGDPVPEPIPLPRPHVA